MSLSIKYSLKTTLIFLLLVLLFQCNTGKKAAQNMETYQQIASKKLSGEIKYNSNSDGSAVLCQSKDSTTGIVKFLVLDASKGNILVEQTLNSGGNVGWHDSQYLKISNPPGHMPDPQSQLESYTYWWDVFKNEKVSALK
jgi:hypothetical protein